MPWFAIAGVAIAAAGEAYSAEQKHKAADANAALADTQAHQAMVKAELEAQQQERLNRTNQGREIAAYAGSGVTLQGSPMDTLAYQAIAGNYAVQMDYYNGTIAKKNRLSLADYYSQMGQSALVAGGLNVAGTVMGGYGTYKLGGYG